MIIINNKREEIAFEDVDFEKGELYHFKRLRKDVVPVDKINKFVYDDNDYEEVHLYDTEGEMAKRISIQTLERKLSSTDYIASKIAEGAATVEDYASVIAERKAWRKQINELEAELALIVPQE